MTWEEEEEKEEEEEGGEESESMEASWKVNTILCSDDLFIINKLWCWVMQPHHLNSYLGLVATPVSCKCGNWRPHWWLRCIY